jgi:hypothetical protein
MGQLNESLKIIKQRYRESLILNSIYGVLKQKKFEVRLFYLFLKDLLDATDLDIRPKIEPIEIEHLKPSDMKCLAVKAERDFSEDMMLQMLSEGCICIGIKYKDEIVSYGWAKLRKCESKLLSFSFELKENEAYAYGIRTLSAFKGKALAPYQRYQTYKYLAQTGRTKIYSIVLFSNIPSIKYHRKLNAKPLKLFLNLKFLNKYNRNFLLKTYQN